MTTFEMFKSICRKWFSQQLRCSSSMRLL